MITDKTKAMVATLYRDGLTIAEICKRTGIRSSATIYNIVTELGIKGEKGKKRGTFSVVLALPIELREWVEEQGDELSKLVSNLIYSRIEGLGEAKNPNLGSKVPYSRVEVLGEGKNPNLGSDTQYSQPRVLNEDKERISDIKTISCFSESEPLGEVENPNSESDSHYRNSRGTTEKSGIAISRVCEDELPFSKIETTLADLDVEYTIGDVVVHNTKITCYVDEDIVAKIVYYYFIDIVEEADEVAVSHEGELLWMWSIKDLQKRHNEINSQDFSRRIWSNQK